LFCIYGTWSQHLKIVEAETDKTMGQPDFTAPVYILPRNQNACIPSTQLCIHALKNEGKKSLSKVQNDPITQKPKLKFEGMTITSFVLHSKLDC
jgi:hypothetical protein